MRARRAAVPPEERVAVFDNDGTLWCEKPVPIQLDFILRRLAEMVGEDPELRDRQPWKAAHEGDHGWLAAAVAEHYPGDDTKTRELAAGILAAFADISVDRVRGAGRGLPAQHGTPHPGPRLPGVRLRPDGRAARAADGPRVRDLHRLGRRARLHAADQRRAVRHPA